MARAGAAGLFSSERVVVQAPMAGSQGSALAIAVCNAGGIGSLPCAMLGPEAIQNELTAITAATSNPYNVNFFCHEQPAPDSQREAAWRALLAPYFAEYGIDPASIASGPGRVPFNHDAADVLETFKPAIVSFHFGLPSKDLVDRVKSWGSQVWSTATTVDEARYLEAHGADAVIAQGLEAGGHRGIVLSTDLATQLATHDLVKQITSVVRVPVIAAGGIANAGDAAAALESGASAVQAGTAYLFCPEASTSPVHRAALLSDQVKTTAMTNLFTGRPARGIVNRLMREIGPINDAVPAFPLATSAILPLRKAAERQGRGEFSSLWAGTNASACRVLPAAELTRELASALK